jgi:putative hydrolase of the HAD superfamily
MPQSDINAIIFDLGGVIVNLDIERSFRALIGRSRLNSQAEKVFWDNQNIFQDYERGLINDTEFRSSLRDRLQVEGTDEEIDRDWNAMLLDVPPDRIELIRELGDRYRLFVLSNTNQIHVDAFELNVRESSGVEDFRSLFERVYYSHQTGYRKPEKEIYELVLNENELSPSNTIFIDDNPDNVDSAGALGIHAVLMEQNSNLRDYLIDF